MFARFDENLAMTLQDIKKTKCYGRTHGRTDTRTDGQRENSIPTTNKVCGGYKYFTIVYLAMGCQKTCGVRFLYIKIFLATLYIIKCLFAFDDHVH